MPVAIKKYEFYTRKTNFIGFIIKLKQISIDLKKNRGYNKLAKSRECYRSKFIFKILQLLLKVYYKLVR